MNRKDTQTININSKTELSTLMKFLKKAKEKQIDPIRDAISSYAIKKLRINIPRSSRIAKRTSSTSGNAEQIALPVKCTAAEGSELAVNTIRNYGTESALTKRKKPIIKIKRMYWPSAQGQMDKIHTQTTNTTSKTKISANIPRSSIVGKRISLTQQNTEQIALPVKCIAAERSNKASMNSKQAVNTIRNYGKESALIKSKKPIIKIKRMYWPSAQGQMDKIRTQTTNTTSKTKISANIPCSSIVGKRISLTQQNTEQIALPVKCTAAERSNKASMNSKQTVNTIRNYGKESALTKRKKPIIRIKRMYWPSAQGQMDKIRTQTTNTTSKTEISANIPRSSIVEKRISLTQQSAEQIVLLEQCIAVERSNKVSIPSNQSVDTVRNCDTESALTKLQKPIIKMKRMHWSSPQGQMDKIPTQTTNTTSKTEISANIQRSSIVGKRISLTQQNAEQIALPEQCIAVERSNKASIPSNQAVDTVRNCDTESALTKLQKPIIKMKRMNWPYADIVNKSKNNIMAETAKCIDTKDTHESSIQLSQCQVNLSKVLNSFTTQQATEALPDDSIVFDPTRNSTIFPFQNNEAAKVALSTSENNCGGENTNDTILVQTSEQNTQAGVKTKKLYNDNRHNTSDRIAIYKKAKSANRKSTRKSQIYEFLSQSQSSDSGTSDPTGDIIKKMIDSGKVSVAINWKGKGRNKMKATRKLRPIGNRKQLSLKNSTALCVESTTEKLNEVTPAPTAPSPVYEPECKYMDNYVKNDYNKNKNLPIVPSKTQSILKSSTDVEKRREHIEQAQQQQVVPMSPVYEVDDDIGFQDDYTAVAEPENEHGKTEIQNKKGNNEGTFSDLARSVMVGHAKTSYSSADRCRLLEFAQSLFSTPAKRIDARNSTTKNSSNVTTNAHALHTTNLSPIATSITNQRRSIGCPSPWRVSDESVLPQTFVFHRNVSNLPTFSSDCIPPTPKKNKTCNNIRINEFSQIESFALSEDNNDNRFGNTKDSNTENMPPLSLPTNVHSPSISSHLKQLHEKVNNENVHLPNPRRTQTHRSPLKTIQIQEVLILPRLNLNTPTKMAGNNIRTPRDDIRKQVQQRVDSICGFDKSLNDETTNITTSKSPARSSTQNQRSPKEYIFGFEEFLDDEQENAQISHNLNENTIHEKLKRLKELRPNDAELPRPSKIPIRFAYDDPNTDGKRQQNIKEMLCSTMIGQRKVPDAANILIEPPMFQDTDPELTFNEKEPHNTYVRPKRKRKARRQFVMFDITDSSEDEDAPLPQKKKRHKKLSKQDAIWQAKVDEFCTTFNEKCAEVENFEILVE